MDKFKKPIKEEKHEYGKVKIEPEKPPVEKEKPSLALSGNLAKDTNTFNGVVIKYNEPPEARKPLKRWRLYCFKGDEELPFYPMHRQSAYLIGRDRLVADIPVDHPSCSKQHAVFQYRLVEYKRKDNSIGRTVKPYIIDLGSTNGTFVNNKQVEAQRYFELREKDLIKFGFSSREYVLLHEESKNDGLDDDYDENLVEVKKEKESPEQVKSAFSGGPKRIEAESKTSSQSNKEIKDNKEDKSKKKREQSDSSQSSSESDRSDSGDDRRKKHDKKKIKSKR